jgi:hypothetical protein
MSSYDLSNPLLTRASQFLGHRVRSSPLHAMGRHAWRGESSDLHEIVKDALTWFPSRELRIGIVGRSIFSTYTLPFFPRTLPFYHSGPLRGERNLPDSPETAAMA